MIKKIITAVLLILISVHIHAQVDVNKLKAALIIEFSKNVIWKDERQIATFNIGYYGHNSHIYNELKEIAKNSKRNNRNINIIKLNEYKKLDNIQLLFVDQKHNDKVFDISKAIEKKQILLVTDRCDDAKQIMLNFTTEEGDANITYEINKPNIMIEQLNITSELLLLGGTEVDVRELYRNMREELNEKTKVVEKQQNIINEQLNSIAQNNISNARLVMQINDLGTEVEKYSSWLSNLNDSIKEHQQRLYNKTKVLTEQDNIILVQEQRIKELQADTDSKEKSADEQNKIIERNNKIIAKQKKTLNKKEVLLQTQHQLLYITVALILTFMALGLAIFLAFRIKIRTNKKLETKVKERTKELSLEIEQRKQTAKALAESEARYRETFDLSPIGIAETMPEKFLKVNKHFCEIFGYSEKELKNMSFKHITHKDDLNLSNKAIKSLYKNPRKIISLEKRYFKKDGTLIWGALRISSVFGEANKVQHLIVTLKDITHQKKIEAELSAHHNRLEMLVKERTEELSSANDELQAINEELYYKNEDINNQKEELEETLNKLKEAQSKLIQAEKMASLGVLTAGIAHEINNPVNFITSCIFGLEGVADSIAAVTNMYEQITASNIDEQLELIKTTKEVEEFDFKLDALREIPETIKIGADRISRIVRSLRTFSHRGENTYVEIDLHENIDATLIILHNQTKGKVEIVKNYGAIPPLRCFPDKLNQVFLNLIINAVHAIEGKGQITITTSVEDEKNILIAIKDNGAGIPNEVKSNIFEAFYTTKGVGKGTGLGLYISYGIVKQHGGEITVNSTVGKGTEFVVSIPLAIANKSKVTSNAYQI